VPGHGKKCEGLIWRPLSLDLKLWDHLVRLYMSVDYFEEQRRDMVAAIRAITDRAQVGKTALDERVMRALTKAPRHEFVPVEVQQYAHLNTPVPIGFDKTISQPLMVAVMTNLLELQPDDAVLEIGTGLGYQAAVLAELSGITASKSSMSWRNGRFSG
jgi:Protein-L-isoaspartate(D-aspartate) O-methyltransferase (PCMT)